MLETLLVLALVFVLAGFGWVVVLFGWEAIAIGGVACAAFGLLVGVPSGFYYHVRLYRALAGRGVLPARWWWSPVRYHRHLRDEERRGVLAWFYLGGAGFLLILLGFVLGFLGLLLA
jgi:hypothetical protein